MTEKVLVITEKPSVASDIAKVLGGMKKEKDYFEGEHYVVSSAVGHLLELAIPENMKLKEESGPSRTCRFYHRFLI